MSPDDAEGYAQSILSLLEDDQLRNQLGTNGQSFAAKHLNKNTILSQLERVYQEVLNYKKRRFGRQFSS
jgi:glycosyltransferase involved in cell wall biosynthesis